MMDALLNQSLFNGIGAYSSNEICYWFYEFTGKKKQLPDLCSRFSNTMIGTHPWANFKYTVLDRGLLEKLVRLVHTYFNFMSGYLELRKYIPPTKYNECEELSFRAVFLKVYRARNITLSSGYRVPVVLVTAGLTKAGASHMRVTKSSAAVYVPDLSSKEIEELPKSWKNISTPRVEDPQNLFVGSFSWYGISDKLTALNSPQKHVRN